MCLSCRWATYTPSIAAGSSQKISRHITDVCFLKKISQSSQLKLNGFKPVQLSQPSQPKLRTYIDAQAEHRALFGKSYGGHAPLSDYILYTF